MGPVGSPSTSFCENARVKIRENMEEPIPVNIRVNIRKNVRPRENDIEGNVRPTRLQPMREKSTHISDPSILRDYTALDLSAIRPT